jgi:hypothetical protein
MFYTISKSFYSNGTARSIATFCGWMGVVRVYRTLDDAEKNTDLIEFFYGSVGGDWEAELGPSKEEALSKALAKYHAVDAAPALRARYEGRLAARKWLQREKEISFTCEMTKAGQPVEVTTEFADHERALRIFSIVGTDLQVWLSQWGGYSVIAPQDVVRGSADQNSTTTVEELITLIKHYKAHEELPFRGDANDYYRYAVVHGKLKDGKEVVVADVFSTYRKANAYVKMNGGRIVPIVRSHVQSQPPKTGEIHKIVKRRGENPCLVV